MSIGQASYRLDDSGQVIDALPAPNVSDMDWAILQTLAYADIFDYPLTAAEAQRYLVGMQAQANDVRAALERDLARILSCRDGYFTLPGRDAIVETRRRRAEVARRLWPQARSYGNIIARLPFVRMVAVTGALAVDNVEPDADVDYLIVAETGRLWLCRLLAVAVVRLARRREVELCPNYLVSERALLLQEHSLYAAHELAQMVPLAGLNVYRRMRRLNAWSEVFLPNALGPPYPAPGERRRPRPVRALAERLLCLPPGAWAERWEMERKVKKLSRQQGGSMETAFCADWCKGHFDGHGRRTLDAFAERLRMLSEALT